jgi:hypothetical protein
VFNALLRHTDRLETDPSLQTYSTLPAALVSAHPFHKSTDPTDAELETEVEPGLCCDSC